jgi:hypothetical protein
VPALGFYLRARPFCANMWHASASKLRESTTPLTLRRSWGALRSGRSTSAVSAACTGSVPTQAVNVTVHALEAFYCRFIVLPPFLMPDPDLSDFNDVLMRQDGWHVNQ